MGCPGQEIGLRIDRAGSPGRAVPGGLKPLTCRLHLLTLNLIQAVSHFEMGKKERSYAGCYEISFPSAMPCDAASG
jgi:hypothetical protein